MKSFPFLVFFPVVVLLLLDGDDYEVGLEINDRKSVLLLSFKGCERFTCVLIKTDFQKQWKSSSRQPSY